MNKVFTFWEPKKKMPGYIRLCLETWKNCLPGYETVVLDYESLGNYLTSEEQEAVRCPDEPLAQQSDCIRCALLKKYGGIWLDADTLLTRPLDNRFFGAEVSMVVRRESGGLVNYGAYIYAAHAGAQVINEWYRQLLPRVAKARQLRRSWWRRILDRRDWKAINQWNYFENAILDPLTAQAAEEAYMGIEKDEIGAFPEESLLAASGPFDAYVRYWFSPGESEAALRDCAGMIMLHNSWTPRVYREMSADEFLKTDTRLAAVLRRLAHS